MLRGSLRRRTWCSSEVDDCLLGQGGGHSSHHRQSYRHGYEFALFMPEALISYLFGIGRSQSQKHSYSFEDARILFCCSATASSAVLLSLTTSCAATCQTQPASSEGRLALLEREGHGLPVKVEYVGTAGQQPFLLQYGWRPGSAQEKGWVGSGVFSGPSSSNKSQLLHI